MTTSLPDQLVDGEAAQLNTARGQLQGWLDKLKVLMREGSDCVWEMSAHGRPMDLVADARDRLSGWLEGLEEYLDSGRESLMAMDGYLVDFDLHARRFDPTTSSSPRTTSAPEDKRHPTRRPRAAVHAGPSAYAKHS